jgi:hypothetical protein
MPDAAIALAKSAFLLQLRTLEMLRDARLLTPSDADELWRVAIGNGLTMNERNALQQTGLKAWVEAEAKALWHRTKPSADEG